MALLTAISTVLAILVGIKTLGDSLGKVFGDDYFANMMQRKFELRDKLLRIADDLDAQGFHQFADESRHTAARVIPRKIATYLDHRENPMQFLLGFTAIVLYAFFIALAVVTFLTRRADSAAHVWLQNGTIAVCVMSLAGYFAWFWCYIKSGKRIRERTEALVSASESTSPQLAAS